MLAVSVLPATANNSRYIIPKEEMRSAWVATVYRIDWPSIASSGSESSNNVQKNDMIKLLDSLQRNNFNALNFQVRSMCDAMYKSSYEPFSSWLTGTRGVDPGWDPLAFVVEECHKRGLECHAWVNPYRFASSSSSWKDGSGDTSGYVEKGWVIDGAYAKILNPSREDVQNHLVKVCQEIVENYDIDGMVFDDYYYDDAPFTSDATEYAKYVAEGGSMSQSDWRRANVHNLMKKLNEMFASTKAWIRFGQSPQGVTCRDKSIAEKYDVRVCPDGYDNNYNGQYIDILGWLKDGLIDYISPQVYWSIGYTKEADYSLVVPWWSEVVDKFNRHLYVAHSIYGLTKNSTVAPDSEEVEVVARSPYFSEYSNQVMINRESALNGVSGSTFYSARYIYNIGSAMSFGHYLNNTVFARPSLVPAMNWKTQAVKQGAVSGLTCNKDYLLTWDAKDNVRYTVYAVPNGVKPENFVCEADYLLGFTYSASYTVPVDYRSGYYYAVCVYDRYGNEWEPSFWQPTYTETASTPQLVYPENGMETYDSFDFEWNAVENISKYALDISRDADFNQVEKSLVVNGNTLNSDVIYDFLTKNVVLYWRIRAIEDGKSDGVTETRSFMLKTVEIKSPSDGAKSLDTKVKFEWDNHGTDIEAVFEIASDKDFKEVKYTYATADCMHQLPTMALRPLSSYYARVIYKGRVSKTVMFTTKAMPCTPPTFKFPLNGGICYSNSTIELESQDGAELVTLQVDKTVDFGSSKCQKKLSDFTMSLPASEVLLSRKYPMEDGETYYARAQVSYRDDNGELHTTDWGEVISFTYNATTTIESVTVGTEVKIECGNVKISAGNEADVKVLAYSMLGRETVLFGGRCADTEVSLVALPKGLYVIKVMIDGEFHVMKYIVK